MHTIHKVATNCSSTNCKRPNHFWPNSNWASVVLFFTFFTWFTSEFRWLFDESWWQSNFSVCQCMISPSNWVTLFTNWQIDREFLSFRAKNETTEKSQQKTLFGIHWARWIRRRAFYSSHKSGKLIYLAIAKRNSYLHMHRWKCARMEFRSISWEQFRGSIYLIWIS